MSMRTPLKNVRHLGSAKEGADHFWLQRVTAVANLVLGLYLVWLIVSLVGADYGAVKSTLANPINAILLLMLVISTTIHMRLGMQVVIEDYVHKERSKIVLILLNNFFAILVGASCVWAILKLSFA
ncbi:MAG: succinate dehydrogenase, hydrophobic membrane anchor protein [Filomicrobium sp.]